MYSTGLYFASCFRSSVLRLGTHPVLQRIVKATHCARRRLEPQLAMLTALREAFEVQQLRRVCQRLPSHLCHDGLERNGLADDIRRVRLDRFLRQCHPAIHL